MKQIMSGNSESFFNNRRIVIGITVGFASVLILALVLWIFRTGIFMKFVPREYAAYSMRNTINQILRESKQASEGILGFKTGDGTDFTIKSDSLPKDFLMPFNDFELCYAPSESSMSLNVDRYNFFGAEVSFNVLWDDLFIGLQIPEFTKENYFAVSAPYFGTQVMNTNFEPVSKLIKSGNLNLYETDLSFSSVTQKNTISHKSRKKLVDSTLEFVRDGKITSNKKVSIKNGGKNKSAYKLCLSFEGRRVKQYLTDVISITQQDAEFGYKNILSDYYSKAESFELAQDILVEFTVFNGRLLKFGLSVPEYDAFTVVKFADCNTLINNCSISIDVPGLTMSAETSGNIIPGNGKVDYSVILNKNNEHISVNPILDFKTGKASLEYNTGLSGRKVMEGKCSNDNGFEVSLTSGTDELNLLVYEGAEVLSMTGSEYMILEKNVTEFGWYIAKTALKNNEIRNAVIEFATECLGLGDLFSNGVSALEMLPFLTSF